MSAETAFVSSALLASETTPRKRGGPLLAGTLFDVATGATLNATRAAGVREVKNDLSKFLKLVSQGETVLATDRRRVVAQLLPPSAFLGQPYASEQEALERLARSGRLRPARGLPPSGRADPELPAPSAPVDPGSLLARARDDRE